MFYVLQVTYHPEVCEGDDPITDDAFVVFQDNTPIPAPNDTELVRRFRSTLGEDVKPTDKVAVIGVVSDPIALLVFKRWNRIAIDGPAGLFNMGTL